jgi:hypothetical protein
MCLQVLLHMGVLAFMCVCGIRDLLRMECAGVLLSRQTSSALPDKGSEEATGSSGGGGAATAASPSRFLTYGSIVVPVVPSNGGAHVDAGLPDLGFALGGGAAGNDASDSEDSPSSSDSDGDGDGDGGASLTLVALDAAGTDAPHTPGAGAGDFGAGASGDASGPGKSVCDHCVRTRMCARACTPTPAPASAPTRMRQVADPLFVGPSVPPCAMRLCAPL